MTSAPDRGWIVPLAFVLALPALGVSAPIAADSAPDSPLETRGEVTAAGEGIEPEVAATRIDGEDRVDTAARLAELTFEPRAETATALVVRSDDFPDALAAAALAGLHEAPVLLTRHDDLPERTGEALASLEVDEVILLGGHEAISPAVADALARDYRVERVAGDDRWHTAAVAARRIADAIGVPEAEGATTVLLASGRTFADALTAGPLAYRGPHPLLLTARDSLPPATVEALDDLPIERAIVLGGPEAISDAVLDQVAARGVETERVFGEERTATATAFADTLVGRFGFTVDHVMLARGDDFPDALSTGPRAGAVTGPILLTASRNRLGGPSERWLEERCPDIREVQAIGGGRAVSPQSVDAAVGAAEACAEPDPGRTITYETGTRGTVHADFDEFRERVAEALTDDRGWSLDGDIEFVETGAGGEVRFWLASPQAVASAADVCSHSFSCRVGDDLYINDERWRESTATYRQAGRSLVEYRWYVVNHEMGHWLGHGHYDCPEQGQPAPVMQQQSVRLGGCATNVWPLAWERDFVRERWLE